MAVPVDCWQPGDCWMPCYKTCHSFPSVFSALASPTANKNRPWESFTIGPHRGLLEAHKRKCIQGTRTWLAKACPLSAKEM